MNKDDKTLDEDQTLSVLQKTARYSDPAKKDFTTKELSSSKYNNREYYYPYGVTLSNIAGGNIESFIQTYGMPEDVEGNTDVAVLNGLIKGDIYAKLMGITFDELSDSAKNKVMEITLSMDSKIESKIPGYKEKIKDKSGKYIDYSLEKMKTIKDSVEQKIEEKIGQQEYNDMKEDLKERVNETKDITKDLYEKGKEKLKTWYEGWR